MGYWNALLREEIDYRIALSQKRSTSGPRLLTDFLPNPGGQTRFFEAMPLNDMSDKKWRWVALIGGIGSGKSYCGAAWACSRAMLDPSARGLITANNFGQLSRASLITLAEVCRDFDIPLEPWRGSVEDTALAIANCQRCYIGPDKAFVYVLSMNSFQGRSQAARGLQVRWVWSDETAYSSEKSFLTLDGRLGRGPGTMKGIGLITTSPCGFNWLYDRFGDPNRSDERKNLYLMFSMSTRENVAALGEDYITALEANYSDELAQQELEGAFISTVSGRAYKYFSRSKHALQGADAEIIQYDPTLDLHLSFDFNYSPAVCVLAQLRGQEIHFFKEFYCLDSDTWELSSLVTDWIDEQGHEADIYIYGDATGAARSAASRLSNWDIVFDAFKSIDFILGHRLHKRFDKVNPPVVNRINSCNCLFIADRVYVDLAECPELVKDWEMVTLNGEGIDKADILRTHLSDAAAYLMHRLYPYKMTAIEKRLGNKIKGVAA